MKSSCASSSREPAGGEECIFESHIPIPLDDEDADSAAAAGGGGGGGRPRPPRPLSRRIWRYLKEMVSGAIKGSGSILQEGETSHEVLHQDLRLNALLPSARYAVH